MDDYGRISRSLNENICFTCQRPCSHIFKRLEIRGSELFKIINILPVHIWIYILEMIISVKGHHILHFLESEMPPPTHLYIDRIAHVTNKYYWHTKFIVCAECCSRSIGAMIEYPYFRKQSWFLYPQTVQNPLTWYILRNSCIPYNVIVYYNMVDLPDIKRFANKFE
tara:strand:- start:1297 stop:1797 length:501 start_codon:yes stop_codon:yes gene_type:complete